jgi:hypothetical protein
MTARTFMAPSVARHLYSHLDCRAARSARTTPMLARLYRKAAGRDAHSRDGDHGFQMIAIMLSVNFCGIAEHRRGGEHN